MAASSWSLNIRNGVTLFIASSPASLVVIVPKGLDESSSPLSRLIVARGARHRRGSHRRSRPFSRRASSDGAAHRRAAPALPTRDPAFSAAVSSGAITAPFPYRQAPLDHRGLLIHE